MKYSILLFLAAAGCVSLAIAVNSVRQASVRSANKEIRELEEWNASDLSDLETRYQVEKRKYEEEIDASVRRIQESLGIGPPGTALPPQQRDR